MKYVYKTHVRKNDLDYNYFAKMQEFGTIEIIMGCMYSGKTALMLKRIENYRFTMKQCLVIKSSKDSRYADSKYVASKGGSLLESMEGNKHMAAVRVVNVDNLDSVEVEEAEKVIGIDEGQFYPDLVTFCEKWANKGRNIIVSGLDGDYKRQPFGQILQLIPKAEKVVKLRAICMTCKSNEASFTERIIYNVEKVLIGSHNEYRACCRACWKIPSE